MNDDKVAHVMTVGRLAEILKDLPPDFRLWPNAVRNLLVCDAQDSDVGFIDFVQWKGGSFVRFGDTLNPLAEPANKSGWGHGE